MRNVFDFQLQIFYSQTNALVWSYRESPAVTLHTSPESILAVVRLISEKCVALCSWPVANSSRMERLKIIITAKLKCTAGSVMVKILVNCESIVYCT